MDLEVFKGRLKSWKNSVLKSPKTVPVVVEGICRNSQLRTFPNTRDSLESGDLWTIFVWWILWFFYHHSQHANNGHFMRNFQYFTNWNPTEMHGTSGRFSNSPVSSYLVSFFSDKFANQKTKKTQNHRTYLLPWGYSPKHKWSTDVRCKRYMAGLTFSGFPPTTRLPERLYLSGGK